ncbi:MAG: DUF87 domain-containing protein, partial [Acidobacteria bacterium]|nr:DUF87 domain-containing protein [Acidobacteriota bacterium]
MIAYMSGNEEMNENELEEMLVGTVKGPGEAPHEYSFITTSNEQTRNGEFVYYRVSEGDDERRIVGTITERKLIRGLPDSFLVDPRTPPAAVSTLLGLTSDNGEIYEITVETIGYFSDQLGDFVNPRIPPRPGQPVLLASSRMLAMMLSPRKKGQPGGAHIGSLLTRKIDEVPIVLAVREVVSTHLAILASTGAGKSYLAGVLLEELLMPHNRAAVLIIDPHGEYGTLRDIHQHPAFQDGSYHPEVRIYTPNKIKVRLSSLTESDLVYLLPEMTEKMRTYLSQAYRALINTRGRGERGLWGFQDLLEEVIAQKYGDEEGRGSSNVSSIDGLEWRLRRRFEQSRIFSDHENLDLTDLFRPGQCAVLQLSDIDETEQQVIVGALLRRTNKARMATVRGTAQEGLETFLPYP